MSHTIFGTYLNFKKLCYLFEIQISLSVRPVFSFVKPGNTTQKQMAHPAPDVSDDTEKRTQDHEGVQNHENSSEVICLLNLFPFPFHSLKPHHSSLPISYHPTLDHLSHRKMYYLTSPGVRCWIVIFSYDVKCAHSDFSVLKDRDSYFYIYHVPHEHIHPTTPGLGR